METAELAIYFSDLSDPFNLNVHNVQSIHLYFSFKEAELTTPRKKTIQEREKPLV